MGKGDAGPVRHFLDLDRIERPVLRRMLEVGAAYKQGKPPNGEAKPLAGKAMALIFEKPSTRTRVSFELGMRQLGGDVIMFDQKAPSSAAARPSPTRRACCPAMSTSSCCGRPRRRSCWKWPRRPVCP
jgi:hypothetical protein